MESAKKSMSPGSGLCASFTTSRAILSDAVALVRGDRFYTIDYTPNNLTNWGFQAASSDLNIDHGAVLYKLVLTALPNHFSKNSVFAHYPLTNPPETMALLKGMGRDMLFSVQPNAQLGVASTFGAPEAAKGEAGVKMTFAEAVLSNDKWESVTSKFYSSTLVKLLKEKQYELGGYQTADIVADVLNVAHGLYIKSILNIPTDDKDEQHHGLFASLGHVFDDQYSVGAQAQGLGSALRDLTHWFVGGIQAVFVGNEPSSSEGRLGFEAIKKLKAANGSNSKQLTWQDVLPTSALLLTTLSASTAAVVASIPQEQASSVDSPVPVTVRAPKDAGDVKKGDLIKLNPSGEQKDVGKYGPELELAQRVAKIANAATEDLLKKTGAVKRVPGAQGKLSKVTLDDGDIKYLNAVSSEYVPYPVSLKVRWKTN